MKFLYGIDGHRKHRIPVAELQTQEAKIEGFFHGELTKIALSNKIDINNFVLDDNLEIKPKGPSPQQLRA